MFLHDAGVEISSMTFDGAPSNISTGKKLGASYDTDLPGLLEPFIRHPITNNKILLID